MSSSTWSLPARPWTSSSTTRRTQPDLGFNSPLGRLETFPVDQWERHFAAGVVWPALTIQKFGPGMRARGRGGVGEHRDDVREHRQTRASTRARRFSTRPDTPLPRVPWSRSPGTWPPSGAGMAWGPNAILPGPFSNTEEMTGNSVQS